jgi:DnaD/phage-associated family protein
MYRIFYLRKTGYKIAPDIPAGIHTGGENAAGQATGGENAAGQKEGTKLAAKTQSVKEEPTAKTQPITRETEQTACDFAPDCVGDPVGDTVGDPVGDAVAIGSENAADHFIINKLNVNINANTRANTPLAKSGEEPTVAPAHAAAERPLGDPELGKVLSFYQDHFGFASPMAIAGLTDFTKMLGADVVVHAMDIAASEKKTSWSYIRGILNRYQREGLRTMADVLLSEQRFEESKARKNSKKQEPEAPKGGGLVDLSASYSGPQGLVSGLDRGW